MSSGFVFTLLLSFTLSFASQAAPLCSSLFSTTKNEANEESITKAIHQIAMLKLSIDQSRVQGSQAVSTRYLQEQFPKKIQELVTQLDGHMPKEKIYELIKKEIRSVQKTDFAEAKETKIRQKKEKDFIESNAIVSFQHDRVEQEPKRAFEGPSNDSAQIFVPDQNAYFYFDSNGFVKFDYDQLRYFKKVDSVIAGALLKDGDTMLLFQHKAYHNVQNLISYSFSKDKLESVTDLKVANVLQLPENIQNMFLSPSNKLALLEGSTYSVIDVRTGEELINKFELPKKITSAVLLNDQQLAVLTADKKLSVIDIATKQTVQSSTLRSINYDGPMTFVKPRLMLSNDGKVLTIAHTDGFISVDPLRIRHKFNEILAPNSFSKFIPTRSYPYAMLVKAPDNTIKLMDMKKLTVEFTFAPSNSDWQIHTMAISPDGTELITINNLQGHNRNSEYWIRRNK